MRNLLAVSCLFLLCVPALGAEKPQAQLRALEKEMERQKAVELEMMRNEAAIRKEADGIRREMIGLAADLRARENEAGKLEEDMAVLSRRARAAEARLAKGRASQERLAASLVRLGRLPPEVAFAGEGDAGNMIESAIILRGVGPELERQGMAIAAELMENRKAREGVEMRRRALQPVLDDIAGRRKGLEVLATKREAAYGGYAQKRKAAQAAQEHLAKQAKDLQGLMKRLEEERREREKKLSGGKGKAPPPGPLPPAVQPAAGKIIRFFGDRDAYGDSQQGISIAARENGLVVAPMNGRVVFAGPFRSYKHLLIIEGGGGYHALLAGLARLDIGVGEDVARGEPVGAMGGAGGSVSPELYFELRKDGEPVDPAWVLAAAGKRKT